MEEMKAAFWCEGLKVVYSLLTRKLLLIYITYEALIKWRSSMCVVSRRKRSISSSIYNLPQFELVLLLPGET
jgi:hypothetical protein